MYLLDTNVISEFRQGIQMNATVAGWARRVHASDLFLSAISVFEVEMGALRMMRRDAVQGKRLRDWIDRDVLVVFRGRILPVDAAVAVRCAQLHVPDPKAERDAFIGATALVHGMSVVTRNVRDFARMGVAVVNPWD
jgi:predicted nucleic acid-binding protein